MREAGGRTKAFVTVQCPTYSRKTIALWKWQFPLPGRSPGTSANSWACSTLAGVFLKCLGTIHLRSAHVVSRKGKCETDCQVQQVPWIQPHFKRLISTFLEQKIHLSLLP